ncbi:hypothetical protein [Nocardioides abyssi]|uniref:Helix-turn-helix domain-containing protein n=1 Tax=Nocardioides abyssi TaxID=3058370 RepID=A0ABT8EYV2_9ACTN|nr:hypothetical protein [Nocardioides abyssi]MDN4163355.1 hypothetical protein [Nocardioides abyssi]
MFEVQADGFTEVPWIDGDDRWTVVVEWGDIDGRREAVGLRLRQASPPRRPVTTSTLRRLRVADVVAQARQQEYEKHGGSLVAAYREAEAGNRENQHLLEQVSPGLIEDMEREAARFGDGGRGRPREYGEDHYAAVAAIYVEALAAGLPPLQAVARTRHVSRPTAARWVARARALGLLGPTTPGRASR